MQAALQRIDITPDKALRMGGNAHSDNVGRKVHDCLYANIILLKEEETLVFIEVDLLGVPQEFVKRLRARIFALTGILQKNILVNAIHTHSAPDICMESADIFDYLNDLIVKIADGVKKANDNFFEAKLGIGFTEIKGVSFNRRIWMKDGSLHMNWENLNPEEIEREAGPVDDQIGIIKLTDQKDNLKAVLVNFALHPAILIGYDHAYSRDWIWGLDERIKEKCGKDVLVYFANGAEGNINHINLWDPEQKRDFSETARIGGLIADQVIDLLSQIETKEHMKLSAESRAFSFPRRKLSEAERRERDELYAKSKGVIPELLDGMPPEFYAADYQIYKREAEYINSILMVIKLGAATIYTIPGEGFCEMGLRLKRKTSGPVFVFGLANGYDGYIPTLQAFDEGGYEPQTAMQSQFGETVAYEMTERLLQLAKEE